VEINISYIIVSIINTSNHNLGKKIITSDKEWAYKHGQMDLYMRDGGKIIKPMVEVDSFMLMETFMMAIGKMTKLMDMEFTLT